MPDTANFDNIKNLLAEGHTESAVNALMQLAKDVEKDYFTSALLLKNRLETLQQNEIEGILDTRDLRTEWARISKGVMNLVEQMERRELPKRPQDLSQPIIETTFSTQAAKVGSNLAKWLLPLAIVGLVLLLWMPKLVGDKNDLPSTHVDDSLVAPPLQELAGQLIWYDESPVSNAILSIKGFNQEYTTESDAKGEFLFKVNPDLIGKQVDFSVRVQGRDQTDIIRLVPENIRKYTLSK